MCPWGNKTERSALVRLKTARIFVNTNLFETCKHDPFSFHAKFCTQHNVTATEYVTSTFVALDELQQLDDCKGTKHQMRKKH
jgi:hypothetical protein